MDSQRPSTARRILVLGGSRSGKSAFAEKSALRSARAAGADRAGLVYAATAPAYEGDPEWAERIAGHRARRAGQGWRTAELGDLPESLADLVAGRDADAPRDAAPAAALTVLVDSVTMWVTRAMDLTDAWNPAGWGAAERDRYAALAESLVAAVQAAAGPVVLVSDEVGLGIVPESAPTRRFRDELGSLNQRLAAVADEVWLVVAGLPMKLKG